MRIHAGGKPQLLDERTFLRIHRSAIVNLKRVHELHRDGGGGVVVLDSGVRLRGARGRWGELEARLGVASEDPMG